jgi:hypothetical protein
MRELVLVALAALCTAAECTPAPTPPGPPDVVVTPAPDGPPACQACTSACNCACCVLATFGCKESRPTAKGLLCEDVCERSKLFAGGALELPTMCISRATSIGELRACGVCSP